MHWMLVVVGAASSGDPLVDWLSRAGALGMAICGVVGFMRGWIVPGPTHERVIKERDRALDIIYEQAQATRLALEAGEKKGAA